MDKKEFHRIRLAEIRKGNLAVLDNFFFKDIITLENIERAVASVTGVQKHLFWIKTKQPDVVGAKHWFFYMSKKVFGDKYSTTYLANYANMRQHSSVLHGIKKLKGFIAYYPQYKNMAAKIEKQVYGG
jgi:chromosomal replication initiation ATPase DnaA